MKILSLFATIFIVVFFSACGGSSNKGSSKVDENITLSAKSYIYTLESHKEVQISVAPKVDGSETDSLLSYLWENNNQEYIYEWSYVDENNITKRFISIYYENEESYFYGSKQYDENINDINVTISSGTVKLPEINLQISDDDMIKTSTPLLKTNDFFSSINSGVYFSEEGLSIQNISLEITTSSKSIWLGSKSAEVETSDILNSLKKGIALNLSLDTSHDENDSAKAIFDYQDYDASKTSKMSVVTNDNDYGFFLYFQNDTWQTFINGNWVEEGGVYIYPGDVIIIGSYSRVFITSDSD